MLKKILIALVVLIGGFSVVVALQPSDFRVEKTATIDAPASTVFPHVNDLRNWDAWSPWAKLDPDAKIAFQGPDAGKDASMSWAGNSSVGKGQMTVVESRPDDLVSLKVDFTEPMEGTSTSEFTFKPEGERTSVTWTMGSHHGFIGKAMCLIMNGKKMIGGEMEKGLAQLKAVAEGGKTS
jgi:uncharacterized protein YndB with AHSA1/START domain